MSPVYAAAAMIALTSDELLHWVDHHTAAFRKLFAEHPEALALPCDVREGTTVAGLVQHVVAAELRYAERLAGRPETPYGAVPKDSAGALFAVHDRAIGLLRELASRPDFDGERVVDFPTRSAGVLRATRRTFWVHALMHCVRHFAQLATLLRQRGLPVDRGLDWLLADLR